MIPGFRRFPPISELGFLLFTLLAVACKTDTKSSYSDVVVVSTMRNAMWNGDLDGKIKLDTLAGKRGLYGLGPLSFLKGEALINDGRLFASKVLTDSTMRVEESSSLSAPFFVYGYAHNWQGFDLPGTVGTLHDLEAYIDQKTKKAKRPFVFKLKGTIETAKIHIQNLPEGSAVTSPEEAHVGQVSYTLKDEEVEIVGFFSTGHQGVFTHHDTYIHAHLLSTDRTKMGHLDEAEFRKMKLYLPR